jgi:hypothetical protein
MSEAEGRSLRIALHARLNLTTPARPVLRSL